MMPIQVLVSNVLNDNLLKVRMSYQEIEPDVICIYLSGRLDVRTVPEIERKFRAMTVKQKRSVIVDLSGVELMNSAGLGLLIANANELSLYGKRMILLNPPPRVEKTVRLACVEQLLPIVHGLAEGLRRSRSLFRPAGSRRSV